jgi:hypothetical protein
MTFKLLMNHTFYIGWLARANTASSLQNESSGSVRTILAFGNAPGHGMRSNGLNHLLSAVFSLNKLSVPGCRWDLDGN